jgi:hypothetical protein
MSGSYNVGVLIALLASPDAVVAATAIADRISAKTTFSKVLLELKGNLLVMRELSVGGVVETYWCYWCQSMAV